MVWDTVVWTYLDVRATSVEFLSDRDWWQWVFFFFPFYIFGELPRYILPVFYLLLIKIYRCFKPKATSELSYAPPVSVLLVGYREEGNIGRAIESLLEMEYPELEIIVVDDNSPDGTYAEALPYAERGLIKLYRNREATGRAGRPVVSNMALLHSKHEILFSVDADASFDRDALLRLVRPFQEGDVGVVSGNLKPRNLFRSVWTQFQGLEYFKSITLWKRWLNVTGGNMQASGAFGAFRRSAMMACGAWDPELAEDADICLKIKRSGYRVVFVPEAVALTNVPESFGELASQRHRWERGFLRTYFHKHGSLLKFWRYDWRTSLELALEYVFQLVLTFTFVIWLIVMLLFYPVLLIPIFAITYGVYFLTNVITFTVALMHSERVREEWALALVLPLYPLYKGLMRWVRCYAFVLEILRLNYANSYLPATAWQNQGKW